MQQNWNTALRSLPSDVLSLSNGLSKGWFGPASAVLCVMIVVAFYAGLPHVTTALTPTPPTPLPLPLSRPFGLAQGELWERGRGVPFRQYPEPVEGAGGGGSGNIARVWANEGGDKVWRSELRATNNPSSVLNSVWDGTQISLFGVHNEVAGFNLVMEAPIANAANVNVSLTSLSGPGGASITTVPATGDGVFDYVGRNIELFYVRYLQIKGLSIDLAYEDYDERHIPERCRRPYDENGIGIGTWQDRPCHDRFYPDIAVPLELHTPFTITAGTNQSIWGDIYIPKTVPAGVYSGTITITENGVLTWQVPIRLRVRDFTPIGKSNTP